MITGTSHALTNSRVAAMSCGCFVRSSSQNTKDVSCRGVGYILPGLLWSEGNLVRSECGDGSGFRIPRGRDNTRPSLKNNLNSTVLAGVGYSDLSTLSRSRLR